MGLEICFAGELNIARLDQPVFRAHVSLPPVSPDAITPSPMKGAISFSGILGCHNARQGDPTGTIAILVHVEGFALFLCPHPRPP